MLPADLDALRDHWFGPLPEPESFPEERFGLWFRATPEQDEELRRRWGLALAHLPPGSASDAGLTQAQRLGLVLLLDQVPRNLFRGTAEAYRWDEDARRVARRLIRDGLQDFAVIERTFVIMPFSHSESLGDQDFALASFARWVDPFAPPDHFFSVAGRRQSHLYHEVIARFGRFPFRNEALGRASTAEERRFLAETKVAPF